MGNSIAGNEFLQGTYLPVDATVVRMARRQSRIARVKESNRQKLRIAKWLKLLTPWRERRDSNPRPSA